MLSHFSILERIAIVLALILIGTPPAFLALFKNRYASLQKAEPTWLKRLPLVMAAGMLMLLVTVLISLPHRRDQGVLGAFILASIVLNGCGWLIQRRKKPSETEESAMRL